MAQGEVERVIIYVKDQEVNIDLQPNTFLEGAGRVEVARVVLK